MRSTRPTMKSKRVRALLLVVVGGIMLGIVGMHVLSLTHSHGELMTTQATLASAHTTTTQAMQSTAVNGGGHPGHQTPGHGTPGEDDHCGLIACCLAVLFGGALLLWVALILRRQRPVAWFKRASTTLQVYAVSALRPRPDLHSLSILRC